MSLTLVCLYIIIGLCFLLFVNYKFLKLFIASLNHKFTTDANRNNIKVANKNAAFDNDHSNDQLSSAHKSSNMWSIPGPLSIPFMGTKWIYLWKYKMSKIHEVYRGKGFVCCYHAPRPTDVFVFYYQLCIDFNQRYGPVVLEVASNGVPIVILYNRQDIEKVLRYPSKYPFRPPTEIVAFYRKMRPDRYASTGRNIRTKFDEFR